ncbi:hypothetical protein ONS96_011387 [Cadophora gregata f. sp. sojae]|nr:hypothetical protein ONS96_011387 [Cadophora gregata f. sp. sojae]
MDPGPVYKRRRPAIACTQCRRRKIGCDRLSPCGPCKSSPLKLHCVYNNAMETSKFHPISSWTPNPNPNPTPIPTPSSNSAPSADPILHTKMLNHENAYSLMDYQSDQKSTADLNAAVAALPDFPLSLDMLSSLHHYPDDGFMDFLDYDCNQGIVLGGDASISSDFNSESALTVVLPSSGVVPALTDSSNSASSASDSPIWGRKVRQTDQNALPLKSPNEVHSSAPWSSAFGSELHSGRESIRTGGSGSDNRLQGWYAAIMSCERLQFLEGSSDNNTRSQPPNEAIQPLIERLVELEHRRDTGRIDRSLMSSSAMAQATLTLTAGAARQLLPPRETCDVLLEAYISSFESVLQILHVPSFRRDYQRFWETSISELMDAAEPFACKLLAAIALGSCVCASLDVNCDVQVDASRAERDGPSPSLHLTLAEWALVWIDYGNRWLERKMGAASIQGSGSTSRSRPSANTAHDLDMVQIMCLLALTRHTHHRETPLGGCFVGGDLTRIGTQMGLHREPRICYPTMSAHEAEMRRRLWATILELALQTSFDECLPGPISPENYDCETPTSLADDDMTRTGLATVPLVNQSPSHAKSPVSVITLLFRTQRTRLRILQLVNAPGLSKSFDASHSLASELSDACQAELTPNATAFQIKLLNSFTMPFVLALHDPFADKATKHPAYYYSRKMRMETAVLLLAPQVAIAPTALPRSQSTAEATFSEPPKASTMTTKLQHLDLYTALCIHGHGHFALVQWKATAALCLDLINELEANKFPLTDSAMGKHILKTVQYATDIFKERMQVLGEANATREYIFVACADAYIEAMLSGSRLVEADKVIDGALKDALVTCCEAIDRLSGNLRAFEGNNSKQDMQMWMSSQFDGDEH